MKEGKSFKLLAIRPLEECSPKFLKALTAGQLYPFYNNYQFVFENGKTDGPIVAIKIKDRVQNDTISYKLYDLGDNKPTVSVAAVVGKNGSGKSTLFDLFYLGVYLVAKAYGVLKRPKDYRRPLGRSEIPGDYKRQLHTKYEEIKKLLAKCAEENFILDPLSENLSEQLGDWEETNEKVKGKRHAQLRGEEQEKYDKEFEDLLKGARMECYYEKDGYYYMFRFKGSTLKEADICMVSKENSKTDISWCPLPEKTAENQEHPLSKHFFYTISMSYAHYGLNESIEGSWVKQLFHKNDGYETPLVINPMRDKGNIDINKENGFAVQRLLSNILDPKNNVVERDSMGQIKENLRTIATEKKVEKLALKFYLKNIPPLTSVTNIKDCVKLLYIDYIGILPIENDDEYAKAFEQAASEDETTLLGSAYRYICNKVVKICKLYGDYKMFLRKDNSIDTKGFCEKALADKSHITFKLKQAMNYIRFQMIESNEIKVVNLSEGQSLPDENPPYVTIQDLSQRIEKRIKESDKQNPLTVIELLPPPIFKVEIILEDGSSFFQMSSGEKQKIYTLSSIIYHLINVNSVHTRENEDIKYSSINILFDEVEQYFHPELQRTFVKDLLGYLARINEMHIKYIDSIQILFATHSPFILSDIPSENVLMLENGKIKETNTLTFAANINEMLADNFFMEDTIGAYAKEKIEDFLRFCKEMEGKDLEKKEELNELEIEYLKKKELFSFVVKSTGEGYVRGMLENHLEEVEGLFDKEAVLRRKIREAEVNLEKLRKLQAGNDQNKI